MIQANVMTLWCSGADPSGPIWLLKKWQPNIRTSRDDDSQSYGIFEITTSKNWIWQYTRFYWRF